MKNSNHIIKYLVTGSKGQLGREFVKRLNINSSEVMAVDIDELDISDLNSVEGICDAYKPHIILNCAAYNDVDGSESNYIEACNVNVYGSQNLAQAANKHNSLIVHFSTDYVFDGEKTDGLYTENDIVKPINLYGKSKLLGEEAVKEELGDYLIFRLSWVYGNGTQNFIHKLREWSKNSQTLKISFDEVSIPTHTGVVVDCVLKALEKEITGTYHLTNSGYTSRFGWADEIIKNLNLKVKLTPVEQSSFNLPANRPKFSAMSNKKISNALDIQIPDWKESLSGFLIKEV